MFYMNRRSILSCNELTEYWLGYRNHRVCYAYEFFGHGRFYCVVQMRGLCDRCQSLHLCDGWQDMIIDKFISVTYTTHVNISIKKSLTESLNKIEQMKRAIEQMNCAIEIINKL